MVFVGQTIEHAAQKRTLGQVERHPRLGTHLALQFLFALGRGNTTQIDAMDALVAGRKNAANGPAEIGWKNRPQALVPANQLLHTAIQRLVVQRTMQPGSHRHVVEGMMRLELIEEPQPLFGRREHRRLVGPARHHRQPTGSRGRVERQLLDPAGQGGRRGVGEQHPQRHFHAALRTHSARQLPGQQ